MMRGADLTSFELGLKIRDEYKSVLRAITFQASGWVAREKRQDRLMETMFRLQDLQEREACDLSESSEYSDKPSHHG